MFIPSELEMKEVWTAASVLLGFQLNAFVWRLNRELNLGDSTKWLPPAEYLNVLAFLAAALGVFALPIAKFQWPSMPTHMLGLSVILFVGSRIALVGHYELLFQRNRSSSQDYCTTQEIIVIAVTVFLSALYLLRIFLVHSQN